MTCIITEKNCYDTVAKKLFNFEFDMDSARKRGAHSLGLTADFAERISGGVVFRVRSRYLTALFRSA